MFSLCLFVYSLAVTNVVNSSGVKNLIQFEFISDNYLTQSFLVDNLVSILDNPKFDRRKTTALYSYGFTETVYTQRKIVDAYLANGDFNFILINYNSIVAYNVFNANEFGLNIAKALIALYDRGYGDFHLVGFSLGGQISGSIGRQVISISNGKYIIPRITALDPAQLPPIFSFALDNVNAGDAVFVDVIHGESKQFGNPSSVGNASFWINGGYSQPNCQTVIPLATSVCSHLMTPKYWAASVSEKNFKMFPARKCSSYNDFKAKKCEDAPVAFMGLYVDKSSSGRFYLDAALSLSWRL